LSGFSGEDIGTARPGDGFSGDFLLGEMLLEEEDDLEGELGG